MNKCAIVKLFLQRPNMTCNFVVTHKTRIYIHIVTLFYLSIYLFIYYYYCYFVILITKR